MDRDSQVGADSIGPLVPQDKPISTHDVNAGQGSGHCVKSRGADEHVEWKQAVADNDSFGCDRSNGGGLDVNEVNVREVVSLVVAVARGNALAIEGVVRRA